MTDLQTFLTMLASSREIYSIDPVAEGRKVEFRLREVCFLFDKDGKFDKIIKLNPNGTLQL